MATTTSVIDPAPKVPAIDISVTSTTSTSSTTSQGAIGQVLTNATVIPYMRKIDIEFAAYRLRPYRRIYYYFDN